MLFTRAYRLSGADRASGSAQSGPLSGQLSPAADAMFSSATAPEPSPEQTAADPPDASQSDDDTLVRLLSCLYGYRAAHGGRAVRPKTGLTEGAGPDLSSPQFPMDGCANTRLNGSATPMRAYRRAVCVSFNPTPCAAPFNAGLEGLVSFDTPHAVKRHTNHAWTALLCLAWLVPEERSRR